MKSPTKYFSAVLIALILILQTAPQVFALEIVIDPNGDVTFFQGQVLGDEDKAEENKAEKQKDKKELKNRPEQVQEMQKKALRKLPAAQSQNKELMFKAMPDAVKLEVQERTEAKKAEMIEKRELKSEIKDVVEDESIKVELPKIRPIRETQPTNAKPSQPTESESESESEDESEEKVELEIRSSQSPNSKPSNPGQPAQVRAQLELRSNAIKAQLPDADLSINPTTGEVKLITPSGQERVIKHLPDQAVEKMRAAGVLTEQQASGSTAPKNLKVETREDGSLRYRTQIEDRRRLWGVIPRRVVSEVVLDDESGTIQKRDVSSSPLSRLLNSMSF